MGLLFNFGIYIYIYIYIYDDDHDDDNSDAAADDDDDGDGEGNDDGDGEVNDDMTMMIVYAWTPYKNEDSFSIQFKSNRVCLFVNQTMLLRCIIK